ncbi:sialate O-acetylesterase [Hyphomonas sp.]|uniref:sialate O-acetylesterase n=1 Tax=Hyphomonas sp. TaxID=87 RepID=UPI003528E113
MMKPIWTLCALQLLVQCSSAETAKLASVFTDHMVVQRDVPLSVFGTAGANASVNVVLDGTSHSAVAGSDGHWSVDLPALPAGGPHSIVLKSGGRTVQSISDVLAGDVFLCSGQSNMEWPVESAIYAKQELSNAANDQIRLLDISHAAALTEQAALPKGNAWEVSSAGTAADFSAVCYFTGRDLNAKYNVPVGLIDASWAGSRIEPWIGETALAGSDKYRSTAELLKLYRENPQAAAVEYAKGWTNWWRGKGPGNAQAPWTGDPSLNWQPTPDGRLSDWHDWGVPELDNFLGMVWHRITFTLTPSQAQGGATVNLGRVDDVDVTWLNGEAIGATNGWNIMRNYDVPPGVLKPGENTLVVNVHNRSGAGGLIGPYGAVRVDLESGGSVPITKGWTWLKAPGAMGTAAPAPWYRGQGFSSMHNGMIAPLAGLRMKGVLWYQGESNAGKPFYTDLLRLLVQDWRDTFGDTELPVAVVQLPRWGALPSKAGTGGWGWVREAQRKVAAQDDKVGIVVTIDLGDPDNLHPPEKQVVAERAARVFEGLAYGEPVVGPSGPEVVGVVRSGDTVRVRFAGVADGLKTISSDRVIGFEMCLDNGKCSYVDGKVAGDTVVLQAPRSLQADEVHFCQGDAPLCNLFDGNGLPAGPFRLPLE